MKKHLLVLSSLLLTWQSAWADLAPPIIVGRPYEPAVASNPGLNSGLVAFFVSMSISIAIMVVITIRNRKK
ncbi:MAG: hypothetical protein PHW52_02625 [Candidatus Pacebacteria bacterium]|nr:hypothetical protein [Candidatus Paceibacterota bacterium]